MEKIEMAMNKPVMIGHLTQVVARFEPQVLEAIDVAASQKGVSRANWIREAVLEKLQQESPSMTYLRTLDELSDYIRQKELTASEEKKALDSLDKVANVLKDTSLKSVFFQKNEFSAEK